jgi:hypothetical protein
MRCRLPSGSPRPASGARRDSHGYRRARRKKTEAGLAHARGDFGKGDCSIAEIPGRSHKAVAFELPSSRRLAACPQRTIASAIRCLLAAPCRRAESAFIRRASYAFRFASTSRCIVRSSPCRAARSNRDFSFEKSTEIVHLTLQCSRQIAGWVWRVRANGTGVISITVKPNSSRISLSTAFCD